jgi:hypothetical protein
MGRVIRYAGPADPERATVRLEDRQGGAHEERL